MQSWLEGGIWIGKGAQATGMTAGLRILSSKADSNTCESFTRSGLKLESVHQESPRSDVFRKRATKPLLNQRQRQKASYLGCGEKELDCCSVVQSPLFRWKYILHLIWRSRSQSLEEEWRGTESMLLEVQCEVSTVSDDLGCHVICWCWSTVFSEVHSQCSHLPGNFRALHASFCWQALWRCWFHFPAGLGTCPHCQRYQKLVQWPWCYCAWLASKLAWPEPHRESMGYCQEEDERHQTQQCRWAEGHCQRNLCFHTTSAVPQTDHLHATPNWGSN